MFLVRAVLSAVEQTGVYNQFLSPVCNIRLNINRILSTIVATVGIQT
jgi:hypothetical protein